MFGWLTERRRNKLLEQPFPPAWERYLDETVAIWRRLDDAMRARLRDLTMVFVAEKSWEGCGGLELTGEIQATIAVPASSIGTAPTSKKPRWRGGETTVVG